MPCRVDPSPEEIAKNQTDRVKAAVAEKQRELDTVEAMLCALIRRGINADGTLRFFDDTRDFVDWDEAGVTFEEFEKWWEKHELKDSQRRQKERAAALKKLTPRERAILGVK